MKGAMSFNQLDPVSVVSCDFMVCHHHVATITAGRLSDVTASCCCDVCIPALCSGNSGRVLPSATLSLASLAAVIRVIGIR